MSDSTIAEPAVQHTPAPWELSQAPDREGHLCVHRDGYALALVCARASSVYNPDYPQQAANARLIAAAPDLLASLKALLDDIGAGLLVRDVTRDGEAGWSQQMIAFVSRLQAAQVAVAKADGR